MIKHLVIRYKIRKIQNKCWHHDHNAIPVVSFIKSLPTIKGRRHWVCTNCGKKF